jgi:hypothetical protein
VKSKFNSQSNNNSNKQTDRTFGAGPFVNFNEIYLLKILIIYTNIRILHFPGFLCSIQRERVQMQETCVRCDLEHIQTIPSIQCAQSIEQEYKKSKIIIFSHIDISTI